MSLIAIYRRGAQVPALCGLFLALFIAAGCGPTPAPPPAPTKPKTDASKTNDMAVTQTNLSNEYASVFEDLPPQKGKDPFFPFSHRRDPVAPVAPVDPLLNPELVLNGIIRTRQLSQAVINDDIFEAGEQQSVHVPNGGHVQVRCIEISSNYVLIQVEGEAEPQRLTMERKKH